MEARILLKKPKFIELATDKEINRILVLLWDVLFSLVLADALITQFLVTQGTVLKLTPFLADLVGTGNFLTLKILGAVLAILILKDVSSQHRRIVLASTCFLVLIHTIVVLWNMAVVFIG